MTVFLFQNIFLNKKSIISYFFDVFLQYNKTSIK